MSTGPLLAARDVVVRYPSTQIGPLDVTLEPGRVLCLLGPNGAGKTSLIKALLGLVPASGTLTFSGAPVGFGARSFLRAVGWASDDLGALPGELTAHELWRYQAWCADTGTDPVRAEANAARLAERLELSPLPGQLIRSFSLGMRRKAQIVSALMAEPRIVVVDEPRNGLDPLMADELSRLFGQVRATGASIIVATHDLDFVEREGTDVLVIAGGVEVASGPVAEVFRGQDSRAVYRDLVSS